MEISRNLAENIVKEMAEIIDRNINYININGEIIASTDEIRVGTYHEGAKIVIDENRTLIIEYDNQYAGTKKGINLPVKFNNKTVGVIGISGKKEEVEKTIKEKSSLIEREKLNLLNKYSS